MCYEYFETVLTVFFLRNILIPNIAKILVIFEQHASEDYRQKSMYFKIAVFRWINTAMIAKVTTPFTSQLGSENVSKYEST